MKIFIYLFTFVYVMYCIVSPFYVVPALLSIKFMLRIYSAYLWYRRRRCNKEPLDATGST